MPRRPWVPQQLRQGPFTLQQALATGLTRKQLEGPAWRRVAPQTYVWSAIPDTPLIHLQALALRFPPGAAYSGRTAGWLQGHDLAPCDPIEVTLPITCGLSIRVGLAIRRSKLLPGDIVTCRGLPTTSPVRTLFDLANRLSEIEAVVCIDTALRLGLVTMAELEARAGQRRHAKGVRRYRAALALADPRSQSPMESRLRVTLTRSNLPAPESQVDLRDPTGRLIGRADLFYPGSRLVIEYDGGYHRQSLVDDDRRQNQILNAGYRLLRFTAPDLRDPGRLVATVRQALAA